MRASPAGSGPSERCLHSMIMLDDGRVVVFGGHGKEHGLNDVFVLDLKESMAWHKPATTGAGPSPRWSSVVWKRNNVLYVFGGRKGGTQLFFFVVELRLFLRVWRWRKSERLLCS